MINRIYLLSVFISLAPALTGGHCVFASPGKTIVHYASPGTLSTRFGFELAAGISQARFQSIDYTGDSNFDYRNKLQWAGGARVSFSRNEKWEYGICTGIRDAGWQRVNRPPLTEPYAEKYQYTFLYNFLRVTVNRNIISRPGYYVSVLAAAEPQWRIFSREKIIYRDGNAAVSSSPLIRPRKFTNVLSAGMRAGKNFPGGGSLELEYRFGIAVPGYHPEIIKAPAFAHSISIVFNLKTKK